ncbi:MULTISPECIES: ATP-binding protein [unclassified Bradyrhizobium]|uniref:ATP-binding protein n=1 Tax=unclassified Bradyrhizobium TaxID=2631580 RepID=UPI001FFB869A|nr:MULTISPECIES: ATP-binding protein [unclassified Bradyrhizobium]MCK1349337.1 ATP-binding protein [Bradyrhizobium sp. CW11]MCK1703002.1 ATP-binding protein [Bradyrhizobium sp. 146]
MLTHPTLDQLHALGLHGMAKAFADIEAGGEAASLGHAEWLALLLERALGNKACRDNRSVLYQRVPRLFSDLALARGDGRPPPPPAARARPRRSAHPRRLGLEPLDAAARHDLLEILEDRYGHRSTIVTSQLPVDQWHALIGDPTYADAVLDRLVHNAHRIDLNGESLGRTRKPGRKA